MHQKRIWALLTIFVLSVGLSIGLFVWMRNWFANQMVLAPSWVELPVTPPAVPPSKDVSVVLPKAWNGKERVNILLLGIDQREGEKESTFRTDTMIVLTIDPISLDAGLLSVPRDTWVEIPDYGYFDRINTANVVG